MSDYQLTNPDQNRKQISSLIQTDLLINNCQGITQITSIYAHPVNHYDALINISSVPALLIGSSCFLFGETDKIT